MKYKVRIKTVATKQVTVEARSDEEMKVKVGDLIERDMVSVGWTPWKSQLFVKKRMVKEDPSLEEEIEDIKEWIKERAKHEKHS